MHGRVCIRVYLGFSAVCMRDLISENYPYLVYICRKVWVFNFCSLIKLFTIQFNYSCLEKVWNHKSVSGINEGVVFAKSLRNNYLFSISQSEHKQPLFPPGGATHTAHKQYKHTSNQSISIQPTYPLTCNICNNHFNVNLTSEYIQHISKCLIRLLNI